MISRHDFVSRAVAASVFVLLAGSSASSVRADEASNWLGEEGESPLLRAPIIQHTQQQQQQNQKPTHTKLSKQDKQEIRSSIIDTEADSPAALAPITVPAAAAPAPARAEKASGRSKSAEGETAQDKPQPEPKDIGAGKQIHNQMPVPQVSAAESEGDADASKPPVKRRREIPKLPTVTYGNPNWAVGPRSSQIATALSGAPPVTPQSTIVPAAKGNGAAPEKAESEEMTTLNVRIVVPQNMKPLDTLMVYPYPVRPPKIVDPIVQLPNTPLALKQMLITSGYSNRIDLNRPYPLYGWRWVHAFSTGLAKSGAGYPHTMFTMYPWVHKVTPYVIAEVDKINDIEEARLETYKKACEEFQQNHVEIENEATAKGLFPVPVKLNAKGVGQVKLPVGNWWLSGARVLPGLRFYWQIPFNATNSQPVNVQLMENNALVIQGGW